MKNVRNFYLRNGQWEAKTETAGARRQEWGNPNRKMARKIRARQADFDKMMENVRAVKEAPAGAYHRPGSHKA